LQTMWRLNLLFFLWPILYRFGTVPDFVWSLLLFHYLKKCETLNSDWIWNLLSSQDQNPLSEVNPWAPPIVMHPNSLISNMPHNRHRRAEPAISSRVSKVARSTRDLRIQFSFGWLRGAPTVPGSNALGVNRGSWCFCQRSGPANEDYGSSSAIVIDLDDSNSWHRQPLSYKMALPLRCFAAGLTFPNLDS